MWTLCVARSIWTLALLSASLTALVMVLAQWPQVMSSTWKVIIGFSGRNRDRSAYSQASHHWKVKRIGGEPCRYCRFSGAPLTLPSLERRRCLTSHSRSPHEQQHRPRRSERLQASSHWHD